VKTDEEKQNDFDTFGRAYLQRITTDSGSRRANAYGHRKANTKKGARTSQIERIKRYVKNDNVHTGILHREDTQTNYEMWLVPIRS
jgi:hypothetical protein